jgi:hypothetical protein
MNNNAEKLSFVERSEKLYQIFIKDESVCGFTSLFKLNGVGSKTGSKIKKYLYDKYGEKVLKKISSVRTSKVAHLKRSKDSYLISDERRQKMSVGIKKYYENNQSAKSRCRDLMVKHCLPKCQTIESKIKRAKSRDGYKHSDLTKQKISESQKGKSLTDEHKFNLKKPKKTKRIGFKHTQYTKDKLSLITKNQWVNGIHKPIFKSQGQQEVIKILKEQGYSIQDEYFVDGKPYDVFVKEKNLLIEFNGTYWHRDPRFFKSNNDVTKIWEKDKNKMLIAESNGYIIKVIWQHDWEQCKDKNIYIKKLLNEQL